MSAPVKFESSRVKEQERKERRHIRQQILDKAKEEHDRKARRKEESRKRGEDTWVLPGIAERLENDREIHGKSKKSKKKKKEKKSKKKKERRRDSSDDDSSADTDSDGVVWTVKKPAEDNNTKVRGPELPPAAQREEWMTEAPEFFPCISNKEQREKKKQEELEKKRQEETKMGQHARELNPYWKDGGTGLPEMRPSASSRNATQQGVKGLIPVEGGGGVAWLHKAYKRCTEQAEEEGRSLEDVAAERYGSLEKLETMICEAERMAAEQHQSKTDRRMDERSSREHRHDRYSSRHSEGNKEREHYSHKYDRSDSSIRDNERYSGTDRWRDRRDGRDRERERERDGDRDKESMRGREKDTRDSGRGRDKSDRYSNDKRSGLKSLSGMFRRPDQHDDRSSSGSNKPSSSASSSSDTRYSSARFIKPGDGRASSGKSANSSLSHTSRHGGSQAWRKPHSDQQPSSSCTSDANDESKDKRKPQRSDSSSSSSCSGSSDDSDSVNSSDSEAEQQQQEDDSVVKPMTEQERNEIGAKIVNAEIMGNTELAATLKAKLEAARKLGDAPPPARKPKSEGDETVILTRQDRFGNVRPLSKREHEDVKHGKRRKKQKVTTHGSSGERERYFGDDDSYSLTDLVQREKMSTAEDANAMFARLAGRSIEKTDDDYQVDDVFVNRATQKQSAAKLEAREHMLAIQEHKRMSTAMEKCQHCFENLSKHLIIAIGIKTYLCLPATQSLNEGHCMIVPMQHVPCATAIDEDVWDEIQIFRKGLTRMFSDRDEDCVFMETALNLNRHPHMVVECVPLERELGDVAPIYFKKAIQESEEEWAQNKKLVDLSKKNIRNSVPKGFPYFSVDFGLQGGFAHVVEDEKTFPSYFGKEILGGMLDLEPRRWRKPMKEKFDEHRKKVLQFSEWWKEYDWTERIRK